jgi:hypothetical protein
MKLDLKKEMKNLYGASAKAVEVVDVPELQFALVDGASEPGQTLETSPEFQNAIQALYGVSYTLKFMSKLRQVDPIDYKVMALEGLWPADPGELGITEQGNWRWTLMIMQPDHITQEMFQEALRRLHEKSENPALDRIRLERFREGLCMQIMHVGPYADEPKTVERMNTFAEENGYRPAGAHHEIYMGDPRLSKPENLKTLLRYPIEKV